jgi:hypothetical protein
MDWLVAVVCIALPSFINVEFRSTVGTACNLKSSFFLDITPCNPFKVNRRFGITCCLNLHGRRIISACHLLSPWFLAYSSTLKIEAKYSTETSVDFERNTWRYIPEDIVLRNHRCEYFKSECNLYIFIALHLFRPNLE